MVKNDIGILNFKSMKKWGPHKIEDKDVLIFSMGSIFEGHGAALSPRNDDFLAQKTCLDISLKTGYPYRGHIPYGSDRVGKIAKDWCPAWIPQEMLVRKLITYLKREIREWEKLYRPVSHVIVFSGHGGNNFLKQREKEISGKIGVSFLYIVPFEGVSVKVKELGRVEVGHADTGEHSVAAYMGILDKKKFNAMEKVFRKRPLEALKRWPPISGLGFYSLKELSGDKYKHLMEFHSHHTAKRFIKDKKLVADSEIGKKLYEKNLEQSLKQIRRFVKK